MDIYRNINGVYRCINNPHNNQTLSQSLESSVKFIPEARQSNPVLQEYNLLIQRIFTRDREPLF